MGAEKGRNIAEPRFIVQLLDRTENLKFVFDCQAVSGLRFDRRRATAEKPFSITLSDLYQIAQRCITLSPDKSRPWSVVRIRWRECRRKPDAYARPRNPA